MIVITGAYGFIGSCLASYLNQKGHVDLLLVDDFSKSYKSKNIDHLQYSKCIERDQFIEWFKANTSEISYVYHLGARTDTTEFDEAIFLELNLNYSKSIWSICTSDNIPLIYASSAATFGEGEYGYKDGLEGIDNLKPLNPYGRSKQDFDLWVKDQNQFPPFWAGLKFFNVFGPNEYHKGRMASVIMHAYHQIIENESIKLFRSHNNDYADGGQLRDFIYIKELLHIIEFIRDNQIPSNIYNVGTGKANTFNDLAKGVFKALNIEAAITYIDTPEDIRDKYQYYTEADMSRLLDLGYQSKYADFEKSIEDYVSSYLSCAAFF